MKNLNLPHYLLVSIVLTIFSCKQSEKQVTVEHKIATLSISEAYDSIAAKKFGADDYGMKKYVMAFLKRGPNREWSKKETDSLQMAHLENIGKMAKAGDLVLAGPFFGNDDLRGIYIFNVTSIEEAERLTNTDPAIQAGSLAMELKEWYGSAALIPVNDIHNSLIKPEEVLAEVYQCPMKCEKDKTYHSKGNCPVCKMDLKKQS
ncbi:heavy metal-binding domain-containing protein [uncultured Psychroserpens sp.]|uniref:heavy metal-binding domain-containing protein n=1 Tax=uncultured Psychroserpens sp. TaxID=255436 RepID=UPI0026261BB4|nr:heavy metal-binding domain-containing protein [uncultured Psychroserpens sp.]